MWTKVEINILDQVRVRADGCQDHKGHIQLMGQSWRSQKATGRARLSPESRQKEVLDCAPSLTATA